MLPKRRPWKTKSPAPGARQKSTQRRSPTASTWPFKGNQKKEVKQRIKNNGHHAHSTDKGGGAGLEDQFHLRMVNQGLPPSKLWPMLCDAPAQAFKAPIEASAPFRAGPNQSQ